MSDAADIRATLGVDQPHRRWPWVLVGVLVIALVTAVLWPSASRSRLRGRYIYETAPIERGELRVKVTAVGKLEPSNAVAVSSELSGIVARVNVDENDRVEAGQVLAELDTQLLKAESRRAQANVHAAEASLKQSLATAEGSAGDLRRAEMLGESGSVSQAELDRARTAHRQAVAGVSLAEAQLQQARASAAAARTNLDKARVISPITGVVLERNVEEGQAVVSSLQVATLFRVAEDLRTMTVDVEVDEADIGRVKVGQQADFTVSAYPDRVFEAQVAKVNLAPAGTSDVVTYMATLTVANDDLALLPGMTATASITAEVYQKALLVPNAALRFSPEGSDLPPPEPVEGRRVNRIWLDTEDGPVPAEVYPQASDGRRTVVETDTVLEGREAVVSQERARRRDNP